MNLVEIQEWINLAINNKWWASKNPDKKNLSRIYSKSLNFLENARDKYDEPPEIVHERFFFEDLTYRRRTIEGYYISHLYSELILGSENSENIKNWLLEWNSDLKLYLDGIGYKARAYQLIKYYNFDFDSEVHELKRDMIKKLFCIELVEFVNGLIDNEGDFLPYDESNKTVKQAIAEESQEFLDIINYLSDKVGLQKIYKKDGNYWPNFWRAKMILEKIEKDVNRKSGGPKSKLEKDPNLNFSGFCRDINKEIPKCLEGQKIKTWKIAKRLLSKKRYEDYFKDNLDKFIKRTFDSEWLELETSLNLSKIVKFNSDYYLLSPNN